ncbi:MAG: hypothetical protein LQ343_000186 [Gyalolechia ehrenbergii]|nr:MAG: hypothetical protein LQ343_000186 [Gyalolechia ehrenbergii]
MGPLIVPWPEDPWDWTIDQVVTAFCDKTFPFRATNNPEALPDATLLEQKLREHCIEGGGLLTEINHASLREEFGILVLGQRGHIIREIQRLRRGSLKYLEYIQNQVPDPSSGYCTTKLDTASIHSRRSLPPAMLASFSNTSTDANARPTGNVAQSASAVPHDEGLPCLETSFQQSLQWLDQLPDVPEPLATARAPQSRDVLSECTKQQEQSQVSRVSDPPPGEADIIIDSPQSALPTVPSMIPAKVADDQTLPLQNETFIIDKNGKKRRRLVLTTTAPVNSEDQVGNTTAVTNFCESHYEQVPAILDGSPIQICATNVDESETTTSPTTCHPSKTRNISTISAVEVHEIDGALPMNAKLESSLSTQPRGYLGTRALPVDDVFYERIHAAPKLSGSLPIRTLPDDDHEGTDNFLFSGVLVDDGKRRYLKARMQYFLRQKAEETRRGNKHCLGIRPYPDRLGPKHQPLSISVFEPTPDGVLATRKDRTEWVLDELSSLATTGQRSNVSDVDLFNVPTSFKEANEENWDHLEKWKYASEHDNVLPIYGDSGSEGEYDLDTWREIEKEKGGKLARPLGRSKQIKKLSAEEVLHTVDSATKLMIEDWRLKRLPRLLPTAWLLWSKSRRDRTKQIQILALSSDAQHFNRRLDKLRKEIANEKWVSTARVTRQCESMRRTIYDLQDSGWKISTLQSKARPEKPEKLCKSQSGKTGGAQSLPEDPNRDTDTSMVETSLGEDLDGFIVDDEEPATAGDDATVMEGADNDGTISDRKSNAGDDANMMDGVDEDATTSDRDSNAGDDANMMDGVDEDATTSDRHLHAGIANTTRDEAPSGITDIEAHELRPETPKQEPSSRTQTWPSGPVDFVDLTLDSDASESEAPPLRTTQRVLATESPSTPPDYYDEGPFQRSQRKKAMFKFPPNLTNVVDLENDSAYDSLPERATPPKLPGLDEWTKITELDPKLLMERADRKRLLIYILGRVDLLRRKNAYKYISGHDLFKAQDGIWRSIKSILGYREDVIGTESKKESRTLKDITAWFIEWTNAVIIKGETGAYEEYFQVAFADKEGFEPFYQFLLELRCLVDFEQIDDISKGEATKATLDGDGVLGRSSQRSEITPTKQKRALLEYSECEEPSNPVQKKRKKRKYVVPESQEAADLRKKAHERVSGRDERQRRLKQSLQKMGQTEDDPSKVAVNLGKLDTQELIFLPASIGARIQPHQKDGVRFLWREIIEDHASEQGCLLAQTMGLGKTMQIISFLVTVAEAAKSPNPNICSQIPRRLRESRTLVLCPPSLIENWYEEFLKWAPEDMAESIGDIRKVSASVAPPERLQIIEDWGDEGGILLLGYSVLRELIDPSPKRAKTQQTHLDVDRHRMVTDILLTQPNIVIADEAHMAKNRDSKLNKIFSRFSTRSRVAMTGSPLSNNLSEYYALIEWVAPGYLGEHREFVAHYEEPIQEGLYQDSPAPIWRKGLKKLELFKREVQPKVHRADISVLASRLKGKSEFVIKVPLTPLQEEIYRGFVDSMDKKYRDEEEPRSTTLWALVDILRLVCNHPKCFHDKVTKQETAMAKKKSQRKGRASMADGLGIDDQDKALEYASPLELGMTADVVQRQLKPFQGWEKGEQLGGVPLDSLSLAYKMKLLLQIIEHSKAAGDKILVFSHSLLTLDYIKHILAKDRQPFLRMDGAVLTTRRQDMTKKFNEESVDILLISTKAGGTGLNLYGANRVIILDDNFNPTWEEQAIGRAYRIGQTKHVYVYRLTTGGTFEEALHNQSLFKQQLATRAVDKRNIARLAFRSADYFRPLKPVEQKDLEPFKGKDPYVLDKILASQADDCFIRDIVPCETFQQEVEEKLTDEEQREVEMEEKLSQLRRTDPAAYQAKLMERPAASNPQPPQHAGVAPELMPPRPIDPNLPRQPADPEVHCGIAGSQPAPPNASNSPPGAAELSNSTRLLFNPGPQGFQIPNTAPVMSNGAFLPHQGFAKQMAPFDSRTNTFTSIIAPKLPRQQSGPVKYHLPRWE